MCLLFRQPNLSVQVRALQTGHWATGLMWGLEKILCGMSITYHSAVPWLFLAPTLHCMTLQAVTPALGTMPAGAMGKTHHCMDVRNSHCTAEWKTQFMLWKAFSRYQVQSMRYSLESPGLGKMVGWCSQMDFVPPFCLRVFQIQGCLNMFLLRYTMQSSAGLH